MSDRTEPINPYAPTYAGFLEQTKQHALQVIKSDGLYRHLRVAEPGTRMWSWDVLTWPGHLVTIGDVADGYTFSRVPDMLDLFTVPTANRNYYCDGAPCIDFRYWAEKLNGGRSVDVMEYRHELFIDRVEDVVLEAVEDDRIEPKAGERLLQQAKECVPSEETSRQWVEEQNTALFVDAWEWGLRDYRTDFIITCYCIDLAVTMHNELFDARLPAHPQHNEGTT